MKLSEAFAKQTYRQRKDNPTVVALTNEMIDMIDLHMEDVDIGQVFPNDAEWEKHFNIMIEFIADSYFEDVAKRVKEHYSV